jgi:hypothetical protein
MNNSTLVMVAVLAAVVVVPIQQASANADTTFKFTQKQSNSCSGFSGCSNTGSIIFG